MQRLLTASLLLLALVSPASALTVDPGIDLFETIPGHSVVDFSENPIPAGAFCSDSPAFEGKIAVQGKPLAASPTLGTTDTIVERLHAVDLEVGGEARQVEIQIRALSLVGSEPFRACGVEWTVVAYADPNQQKVSAMAIRATDDNGGTFDSLLDVNGTIRFVSTLGTVEMNDELHLKGFGSPWVATVPSFKAATNPKGGAVQVKSVSVDTDLDGKLDTALRGTSNFNPGWSGRLNVPISENDRLTAHFVLPPHYVY